MYKVEYFPEVTKDIDELPLDVLLEVKEYFHKYKTGPYDYSQKLYNKLGLNLEGYRKTYVADAKYRIILQIKENTIKVVEIIVVGKREDLDAYKQAHKRVNEPK